MRGKNLGDSEAAPSLEWSTIWGDGRCTNCQNAGEGCKVRMGVIEKWVAEFEAGKKSGASPPFSACERCGVKKIGCELPMTAAVRASVQEEKRKAAAGLKARESAATASKTKGAKVKGKTRERSPSVASSGIKRKAAGGVWVEMPPPKRKRSLNDDGEEWDPPARLWTGAVGYLANMAEYLGSIENEVRRGREAAERSVKASERLAAALEAVVKVVVESGAKAGPSGVAKRTAVYASTEEEDEGDDAPREVPIEVVEDAVAPEGDRDAEGDPEVLEVSDESPKEPEESKVDSSDEDEEEEDKRMEG